MLTAGWRGDRSKDVCPELVHSLSCTSHFPSCSATSTSPDWTLHVVTDIKYTARSSPHCHWRPCITRHLHPLILPCCNNRSIGGTLLLFEFIFCSLAWQSIDFFEATDLRLQFILSTESPVALNLISVHIERYSWYPAQAPPHHRPSWLKWPQLAKIFCNSVKVQLSVTRALQPSPPARHHSLHKWWQKLTYHESWFIGALLWGVAALAFDFYSHIFNSCFHFSIIRQYNEHLIKCLTSTSEKVLKSITLC